MTRQWVLVWSTWLWVLSGILALPQNKIQTTLNLNKTLSLFGDQIFKTNAPVVPVNNRVVIAYVTEWNDMYYDYNSFPADKVTHVNFAFARIVGNNIQLSTTDGNGAGLLPIVMSWKTKNPSLKIGISIGGWALSADFSKNALDPQFAKNIATFVNSWKLDGVDVDWEYPVWGGENYKRVPPAPQDKANYIQLLKNIRDAIGPNKFLSIAAAGKTDDVDTGFDIYHIGQVVDWINVMSYDLTNRRDVVAGHNSAVQDVMAIMHYYSMAVPPSKLVMGFPFYGKTFPVIATSCSPDSSGNPVAARCRIPTNKLEDSKTGNDISGQNYPDLANKGLFALLYGKWSQLSQINAPEQYDAAKGAYFKYWSISSTENAYITYDKDDTITAKANWGNSNGFLGGMYWAMNLDTSNFHYTNLIWNLYKSA